MNTRRHLLTAGAACAAATALPAHALSGGWETLIYGPTQTRWDRDFDAIGQGHWRFVDSSLEVRDGQHGYLVTKKSWANFEVRAEFWADSEANSGLFLRCQDRAYIDEKNACEVNIYDERPEQAYATGAIVGVSRIDRVLPAAHRWNVLHVLAQGDRVRVTLNGRVTANARDPRFVRGPLALQSAGGTVRFRKLHIREA